MWGSDFPHAESTWPKSRDFLSRMFAGVPEPDLRKITSENAARLFGFTSDEAVGKRAYELIVAPAMREEVERIARLLIEEGEPQAPSVQRAA